jgi:hypothetical protein
MSGDERLAMPVRTSSTWARPKDREIRRTLTPDVDAVVVVSRDDRIALRLALVVEGTSRPSSLPKPSARTSRRCCAQAPAT